MVPFSFSPLEWLSGSSRGDLGAIFGALADFRRSWVDLSRSCIELGCFSVDFGRSWTDFCRFFVTFSSISASENDKSTAEHAVFAEWHAKRKMLKIQSKT